MGTSAGLVSHQSKRHTADERQSRLRLSEPEMKAICGSKKRKVLKFCFIPIPASNFVSKICLFKYQRFILKMLEKLGVKRRVAALLHFVLGKQARFQLFPVVCHIFYSLYFMGIFQANCVEKQLNHSPHLTIFVPRDQALV